MRVVMGGMLGAALAYAGTRFVRAGYPLYGQMISGGGIAVLYVSTYAAFNFYHLVPQPAAFAMMCGVTLVGATLADRQRSQGLALMAVGGGFATPFLLPGDANAHVALFTYDAIIVAGTMYLAGRRDWPFLNLLSYVAVGLTVGTWAGEYYTPAKYFTTEIFLTIFCAMFLYILRATRRSESALAETVRMVLWSAPAAYYVASLAVLSEHSVALLVFLLCRQPRRFHPRARDQVEHRPRRVLVCRDRAAVRLDPSARRLDMADTGTGHGGGCLRAHAAFSVRCRYWRRCVLD